MTCKINERFNSILILIYIEYRGIKSNVNLTIIVEAFSDNQCEIHTYDDLMHVYVLMMR